MKLIRVGRVWHYRFQIGGKRIQKSTRERSYKRADKVAQREWDRAKVQARGEEPIVSFRELVDKWIAVHTPIRSEAHIKSVETFGRLHLYGLGNRPVDRITTEMIETARAQHLEAHAPASANHWLRIVKLLFNWAKARGMIAEIPWEVRMLKVQKKPRKILPISRAKAWLDAVDRFAGGRVGIAIAIRLMLGLGLREREALRAFWEWFDWERRTYTPGDTKGREAEPLPVPEWLVEYLEPRRKPRGLVIPAPNGEPFTPGYCRRVMLAANAAIGLAGLTPHRLRGTFATLLSESGVPVQDIQAVLRHKDPVTTLRYLEKNLDRAIQGQNEIALRMGLSRRKSGER